MKLARNHIRARRASNLAHQDNSEKRTTRHYGVAESVRHACSSLAVKEEDIRHVLAACTQIRAVELKLGPGSDDSQRLMQMEETLQGRIIGQDEAVRVLSRAMRRAHTGVRDPDRPMASFVFAGPTGVGKTELAKALASFLFDSDEAV
ncbi:hypothetical protein GOP47_0017272 [Adiantum capillus-veneris]|uniref:ATPase AAA-type core domain-containing protein n=1 Tax=Adiantum capillus-veneris TaxID=13818 RepID=A0A9D4Z9J8_ADICA|nr:hypothetical protein GOP47_0017272 [Adiantum capillus-veneris]